MVYRLVIICLMPAHHVMHTRHPLDALLSERHRQKPCSRLLLRSFDVFL